MVKWESFLPQEEYSIGLYILELEVLEVEMNEECDTDIIFGLK